MSLSLIIRCLDLFSIHAKIILHLVLIRVRLSIILGLLIKVIMVRSHCVKFVLETFFILSMHLDKILSHSLPCVLSYASSFPYFLAMDLILVVILIKLGLSLGKILFIVFFKMLLVVLVIISFILIISRGRQMFMRRVVFL